jgi:pimeloyl-ACP methyl ester carboxylesterase/sugar-specific transcriptional regulator TrmB
MVLCRIKNVFVTKVSHNSRAETKVAQKKAKNVLLDYGLTNKEADIYIFLAKNVILTGGEISKRTKMARSLVYRILKNLQTKGLVESTLESPRRFVAVPFDKALDLIIKTKKQEALKVEREKQDLIDDWKTISKTKPAVEYERFVIIEGNKKIHLKMLQMLKETKKNFSGTLTISGLAHAEQFGVFDVAYNHPLKNRIKFQFITDVNKENLEAFKLFKPKLKTELDLRARSQITEITLLPRMVTKDKEEVMFFIRPEEATLTRKQGDVCIYTNCTSLVETFNGIFQNLWHTSLDIDAKIRELEMGKPPEVHQHLQSQTTKEKLEPAEVYATPKTVSEKEEFGFASASKIPPLKEEERDLLDVASVVGEEFSPNIIEKVTGCNKLRILKTLVNIESEHKLIQANGDNYRFDNPTIREALYNEIKPRLRRVYHSLVAQNIEETSKDHLMDFASELAHHYYNSKNALKAIPYLLKAGEQCRRQFRFSDAFENYSRALEMMGKDKIWREERKIAIENLGDLSASMGDHEKANECYTEGIRIAGDVTVAERMRRKIRRKRVIIKNGRKIPYFVYGEGEPTVLLVWLSIHFMSQIHYFSQKHKVAIMALEEMFVSEDLPTEYTVRMFTENLGAIVEDLQDSQIYLVGTGFGGTLAIRYVAEYPGKIAKLALLATPPKPTFGGSEERKRRFKEFWALALQSPSWGLKNFHDRVIAPFNPRRWVELRSRLGIRSAREVPPESILIGYKLLLEADVRPFLGKVRIPTLILHGEKDILPMEDVEYMKKRIPSSKLYIFKDADVVSVLKPDEFNSVLEEFLTTGQVPRD